MKLGANDISKIYLGDNEVSKIYLGDVEVYSSADVPWTPANITTSLWLDASDENTIVNGVGDNVAEWQDKSGNSNYNAKQLLTSEQPTINQETINGLNVLTFNGDYMTSNVSEFSGNNTPCTFIGVASINNVSNAYCITSLGNTSSDTPLNFLSSDGGNYRSYRRNNSGSGTDNKNISDENGTRLFCQNYDGSTIELNINGENIYSTTEDLGQADFDIIGIGALVRTGIAFKLVGNIAELIYVPNVVTTETVQLLEGYLAHKWGLTSNLPVDHPYAVNRPYVLQYWNPTQLPTTIWIDADDSTTIEDTTGSVTKVLDKSGNLNHFVQSDPTNQPSTLVDTLNNRNVITFNKDYLELESGVDVENVKTSVFVVDKMNNSTVSSIYGEKETSGNFTFIRTNTDDYDISVDGVVNNTGVVRVNGGDDSNRTANIDLGITVTEKAQSNMYIVEHTNNIPVYYLYNFIFSVDDYRGVGNLAEILFINSLIKDTEKQLLEGYLAHKWGINWKLPSDHPYYIDGSRFGFYNLWTPSQIDVDVWLDASDESKIISSGGLASDWNDKSGNTVNAVQTIETNRPITGSQKIGELNALLFNGSDNYMNLTSSLSLSNTTIFVVYNTKTYTDGRLIANAGSGGSKSRFYIYEDGIDFGNNETNSVTTIRNNTEHLLSATVTGTTDGSSQSLYINGNLEATASVDRAFTEVDFDIGARSGLETNDCLIGEIIVLYNDTSTDTRQTIEGYLAHKWKLTDDLPVDHPYKSIPPFLASSLQFDENGNSQYIPLL
jgi:hypothetical protein